VHDLIALFLEVIVLAIIHCFVGLAALRFLIVSTRMIVASIFSMRIVRSWVNAIVLVVLMEVAILVARMLLIA
jgi:hypothetical protein